MVIRKWWTKQGNVQTTTQRTNSWIFQGSNYACLAAAAWGTNLKFAAPGYTFNGQCSSTTIPDNTTSASVPTVGHQRAPGQLEMHLVTSFISAHRLAVATANTRARDEPASYFDNWWTPSWSWIVPSYISCKIIESSCCASTRQQPGWDKSGAQFQGSKEANGRNIQGYVKKEEKNQYR